MKSFARLIELNEEWLMEKILIYAQKTGYTAYTSTLKEAWRLSIAGLSDSIIAAIKEFDTAPEFNPEFDFVSNSVAQFGILEAQRHRKRGISLAMFLGLLKYYRQTYLDLIEKVEDHLIDQKSCGVFVSRVFDIIEIALCVEWARGNDDLNMQQSQREMTNEKNKYLTIFESFPSPVFLVRLDGLIDNMNIAAANYFNPASVSGGHYYKSPAGHSAARTEDSLATGSGANLKASKLLPWLARELQEFQKGNLAHNQFTKETVIHDVKYKFKVRISPMLDVSHKFDGIVLILEDISRLAATENEIQQLKGIIPICMHCKEIRDDAGFWNRFETYIETHSEAQFSHSICEKCLKKFYPKLGSKKNL